VGHVGGFSTHLPFIGCPPGDEVIPGDGEILDVARGSRNRRLPPNSASVIRASSFHYGDTAMQLQPLAHRGVRR
jgi:hypothetical protein